MMIFRRAIGLAVICGVVVATAACSRSPRVNFYTLAADAKQEPMASGAGAFEVAVAPITLPELVDRPQLVISIEGNQVDILETQRWAEPLKSQIPRLLAENLGNLLGSARVTAYPQRSGKEADYWVLLDIRRFESASEGVIVDAFWTIRGGEGGSAKTGRSLVREPAGGSYDAVVSAYSRALFAVSNDIATALRSLGLPKN